MHGRTNDLLLIFAEQAEQDTLCQVFQIFFCVCEVSEAVNLREILQDQKFYRARIQKVITLLHGRQFFDLVIIRSLAHRDS